MCFLCWYKRPNRKMPNTQDIALQKLLNASGPKQQSSILQPLELPEASRKDIRKYEKQLPEEKVTTQSDSPAKISPIRSEQQCGEIKVIVRDIPARKLDVESVQEEADAPLKNDENLPE